MTMTQPVWHKFDVNAVKLCLRLFKSSWNNSCHRGVGNFSVRVRSVTFEKRSCLITPIIYTVLIISLMLFCIAGWRLPQAFHNRFVCYRMNGGTSVIQKAANVFEAKRPPSSYSRGIPAHLTKTYSGTPLQLTLKMPHFLAYPPSATPVRDETGAPVSGILQKQKWRSGANRREPRREQLHPHFG